MKKIYSLVLSAFLAIVLFSSCEEESDMAFDRVASPALVEVETLGKYTPLDQVTLTVSVSDLDKTGILDNTVGIDTIPATLPSIQVLKDVDGNTETFYSPLTLTEGTGTITANWSEILPSDASPEDGLNIKFEYFETYEDVAFRNVYQLSYSTTAFTGELPMLRTTVDGEEVALPIVENDQTYTFSYDLISLDKSGVDITVEQKINDGDFVTITSPAGDWPDSGTIPYVGSDYTEGDEITVSITGQKGELVSSESFTFTVGLYAFPNISDPLTLSLNNVLDLNTEELFPVGNSQMSTVQLTNGSTSSIIGFQFTDQKQFVVLDEETYADLYNSKDFAEAKRLFESQEKVTSVEDVEIGDLYLYQFEQDGSTYTGIIKVTDYLKTNQDNNDTVTLEYTYGTE